MEEGLDATTCGFFLSPQTAPCKFICIMGTKPPIYCDNSCFLSFAVINTATTPSLNDF